MHPGIRTLALLLRSGQDSHRDDEVAILGGTGAPSGATYGDKTLSSGQPALAVRADATDPGKAVAVTLDGGTTWDYLVTEDGGLAEKYGYTWVAGQRGKPGINADILNASDAVRMIADPEYEVQGVNAVSAGTGLNPDGGVTCTTAGADGDEIILAPHQDASQSGWKSTNWPTNKELVWECDISTGLSVASMIFWAGLKLTSTEVTATDADQVFFRYEDDVAAGNIQAVSSIGGVDDEHDTGVAVAVSTRYRLRITIDASRAARFYVNGVLVETSGALTDAKTLIPFIGVAADGAAAAAILVVRGQKLHRAV